MNILDLLKGKVALVNTDMNVEVELIIREVVENTSNWSRETEPATLENGWWPSEVHGSSTEYVVHFVNGVTKRYGRIGDIRLKQE